MPDNYIIYPALKDSVDRFQKWSQTQNDSRKSPFRSSVFTSSVHTTSSYHNDITEKLADVGNLVFCMQKLNFNTPKNYPCAHFFRVSKYLHYAIGHNRVDHSEYSRDSKCGLNLYFIRVLAHSSCFLD